MELSSDIIYDVLARRFEVRHMGITIPELVLRRPKFLVPNSAEYRYEKNGIYIAPAGFHPPQPQEACVVIFVGGSPPSWGSHFSCIFSIADAMASIIDILNLLQDTFDFFDTWDHQLAMLLEKNADLSKMLEVTAPVINREVGFSDYNLVSTVASPSDSVEMKSSFLMENQILPEEVIVHCSENRGHLIVQKEPYHIKINGESPAFCYNIYQQNSFLGVVYMSGAVPYHKYDFVLFEHFIAYFRKAVQKSGSSSGSGIVTLKRIFSDLLNGIPVSESWIQKTVEKTILNINKDSRWICIVLRQAKLQRTLPAEYFCAEVERLFPEGIAIWKEPYVAVLYNLCEDDRLQPLLEATEPFLRNFCFQCGVSSSFSDIMKSRFYFQQAICALDTGASFLPGQRIFRFEDQILRYMLKNCSGEFLPEFVLPEGLLKLRPSEDSQLGSVDYYHTLKTFLDNEMNISRTANELFIHRTTLLTRLEKIKKAVALDTPEQRLYIRNCLYLYDMICT